MGTSRSYQPDLSLALHVKFSPRCSHCSIRNW